MTPELRAALMEAIAPIIDDAIDDAELQIIGKLSEIDAISQRHALALNTRYALLAAADDLEAATFPDRVPEPGQIADWLRARADQITDVPGA